MKKAITLAIASIVTISSLTIPVNAKEVTLQIGSNTATVDGKETLLENSPVIKNATTMVPIRFISENLGLNVEWNEDNKTITVKDNETADPNAAKESEDYYIFELSDNVNRQSVNYKNRYGIELAGDLYTPKAMDKNTKYPAIVIGPPYGGVKEQGPGVYANQLAQRGFQRRSGFFRFIGLYQQRKNRSIGYMRKWRFCSFSSGRGYKNKSCSNICNV